MAVLMPALVAGAIAAGIALGLLAVSRLFGRWLGGGLWLVPLALGGYVAGHAWLRGWFSSGGFSWPPPDAYDWIPFVVVVAALLGCLESVWPSRAWTRLENRLLVGALLCGLVLYPLISATWTIQESAAWLAGTVLGIAFVWSVADSEAHRLGRAFVLPMALWVAAVAVCMQLCRATILMELSVILLACLAAAWIVSLGWASLSFARGGVGVIVCAVAGMILFARFYGYPELPPATAIALAGAPLALAIDRIPAFAGWKPLLRSMLRIVALLVPIGVAVGFALQEFLKGGIEGY